MAQLNAAAQQQEVSVPLPQVQEETRVEMRRQKQRRQRRDTLMFWLFILPALLIFLNVVVIPFIIGIIYSFTDWDGFNFAGSQFIGLTNYKEIFAESRFHRAFGVTFLYALFMIVFVNLIGFALALLVTSKIRSKNILRSIYFLPNMIGGLILGFVWQFIFRRLWVQVGELMNLEHIFFNWLTQRDTAFLSLVIVGVWQQAGYVMIIYIAGIQSIPTDVIEAASIDGASALQRLRHITLPLMIPTITINLFVTMSTAMKQYDLNLSLTNGGPGGSTEMIAMNIYQTAYKYLNYSEAQAKAVIFFLVIMVITVLQMGLSRRKETRL